MSSCGTESNPDRGRDFPLGGNSEASSVHSGYPSPALGSVADSRDLPRELAASGVRKDTWPRSRWDEIVPRRPLGEGSVASLRDFPRGLKTSGAKRDTWPRSTLDELSLRRSLGEGSQRLKLGASPRGATAPPKSPPGADSPKANTTKRGHRLEKSNFSASEFDRFSFALPTRGGSSLHPWQRAYNRKGWDFATDADPCFDQGQPRPFVAQCRF
eukprot:CAMPEP_0117500078 /NCGR_PEP_ID=MMETSP0784-20121206/22587_1 /TAXON_ID=39447 /ORGANISM="" /LENGTH=213 /DNA_ID=CAMNT_0005295269 /DNA_START=173 /DNA_END=814 /DNA_ORIENTATION=+